MRMPIERLVNGAIMSLLPSKNIFNLENSNRVFMLTS